jgi:hypothetical protein
VSGPNLGGFTVFTIKLMLTAAFLEQNVKPTQGFNLQDILFAIELSHLAVMVETFRLLKNNQVRAAKRIIETEIKRSFAIVDAES